MRSGLFDPTVTAGTFRAAGHDADYWSSRGANNVWGSARPGSYYLAFYANDVNPSYGPTTRYIAFPSTALVLY